MALVALPPPKAKPFSFSPLQHPNIKPAKHNSPTNVLKHQESLHNATIIRNANKCQCYGILSSGKDRNTKRTMAMKSAASVPVPENVKDSESGKILKKKWRSLDVVIGVTGLMHLLCFLAPFTFNWGAFWVAVGLYLITGLFGITLCFHRNLCHKSFKLPKWLEYTFAYCGVLAVQGTPTDWVSIHRYHHQFGDSDKDPHSPIEGFLFSHMTWIFDLNKVIEKVGMPDNVGDLEIQPFYKFIESTYLIHLMAHAALLYSVGGISYIVWGMAVRIVWVYHITMLVNSVCHVWGKQEWNTGDLSRNNWWVALLSFGEGWHNNHHAFEYSARHGLKWWQIDMTWYVIRLLQAIGLATEVKLPSNEQMEKMAYGID